MHNSIKSALKVKKKGFHIGHRLVLPFRCQVLKLIVEAEIFTELVGSKHIKLQQGPQNTSIYFRDIGKLSNFIGTYKVIKLIACEWDTDLSDMNNHIKLICEIKDNHQVDIHKPSDDRLFIE